MYDMNAATQFIVQTAQKYGIDPRVALAVARSEGLREGVWQSNVVKNGRREPSYGPFQLYTGGGLGNEFQRLTGLDPSDPANVNAGIEFALKHAGKNGWGSWYGARDTGIGNWEGIGATPVSDTSIADTVVSELPAPPEGYEYDSEPEPRSKEFRIEVTPGLDVPGSWENLDKKSIVPDPSRGPPPRFPFNVLSGIRAPSRPYDPLSSVRPPAPTPAPAGGGAAAPPPNSFFNQKSYRDAVMPDQKRMLAQRQGQTGGLAGLFG